MLWMEFTGSGAKMNDLERWRESGFLVGTLKGNDWSGATASLPNDGFIMDHQETLSTFNS